MVVFDQATKIIVVHKIVMFDKITIIPNFFYLTYIVNKGAAFGILQGKGWLLLAVSIVVLVLVIAFFRVITEGFPERYYALALIVSGIIGNSIDRIWRHEVVDFLDFYFGSYNYPAFNVADSCITIGVIIYVLSILLRPQKKEIKPTGTKLPVKKL